MQVGSAQASKNWFTSEPLLRAHKVTLVAVGALALIACITSGFLAPLFVALPILAGSLIAIAYYGSRLNGAIEALRHIRGSVYRGSEAEEFLWNLPKQERMAFLAQSTLFGERMGLRAAYEYWSRLDLIKNEDERWNMIHAMESLEEKLFSGDKTCVICELHSFDAGERRDIVERIRRTGELGKIPCSVMGQLIAILFKTPKDDRCEEIKRMGIVLGYFREERRQNMILNKIAKLPVEVRREYLLAMEHHRDDLMEGSEEYLKWMLDMSHEAFIEKNWKLSTLMRNFRRLRYPLELQEAVLIKFSHFEDTYIYEICSFVTRVVKDEVGVAALLAAAAGVPSGREGRYRKMVMALSCDKNEEAIYNFIKNRDVLDAIMKTRSLGLRSKLIEHLIGCSEKELVSLCKKMQWSFTEDGREEICFINTWGSLTTLVDTP